MPFLYRSMEEDGEGRPLVGPSARRLGVRSGIDVPVTEDDEVETLSGGMSVTPGTPAGLPSFRRPPSHGGTGLLIRSGIDSSELGTGLVYRPDDASPETHGFVEPAWTMRLDEYEDLLALTRESWRLCPSPNTCAIRREMTVAPYMTNAYLGALADDQPLVALREVVRHELHDRRADREVVFAELEVLRDELRKSGRSDDEEVVLEVMDFVVGWCSPRVRL